MRSGSGFATWWMRSARVRDGTAFAAADDDGGAPGRWRAAGPAQGPHRFAMAAPKQGVLAWDAARDGPPVWTLERDDFERETRVVHVGFYRRSDPNALMVAYDDFRKDFFDLRAGSVCVLSDTSSKWRNAWDGSARLASLDAAGDVVAACVSSVPHDPLKATVAVVQDLRFLGHHWVRPLRTPVSVIHVPRAGGAGALVIDCVPTLGPHVYAFSRASPDLVAAMAPKRFYYDIRWTPQHVVGNAAVLAAWRAPVVVGRVSCSGR